MYILTAEYMANYRPR